MRNPDERRGDLRAQLAAHRLAERRVDELCERRGRERVAAAMDELYAYSERVVRGGDRGAPRRPLRGRGRARGRRRRARASASPSRSRATTIEIDFAGTAPQHEGNLNCPLAVTRSACYFVVRCLTDPDAARLGRRLRARDASRAPAGCLVNARPPAAVAAGNVETSSRIVDVLFARASATRSPSPRRARGR